MNPANVFAAAGRKGGSVCGPQKARSSEVARAAVAARWARYRAEKAAAQAKACVYEKKPYRLLDTDPNGEFAGFKRRVPIYDVVAAAEACVEPALRLAEPCAPIRKARQQLKTAQRNAVMEAAKAR